MRTRRARKSIEQWSELVDQFDCSDDSMFGTVAPWLQHWNRSFVGVDFICLQYVLLQGVVQGA